MSKEKIAIGCDHAGLNLKSTLKADLEAAGYEVIDVGTNGSDSVDYPDFGYAVSRAVAGGEAAKGVLVCGTGIGISMAATRPFAPPWSATSPVHGSAASTTTPM